MPGFHSHPLASGRRLTLLKPLGPSGLTRVTKEVALVDPTVALDKGARPKAKGRKVHIGFRLSADVVESLKASGPGYNRRVEQSLREAGFGASKNVAAKKRYLASKNVAAKRAPPAKRRA
jgi:uncharacterized protein (DUF4415 family)